MASDDLDGLAAAVEGGGSGLEELGANQLWRMSS